MGRGKVAEISEIAHFRIDANHKKALEAFGKKTGKKFSDLARHAIKEYIEVLQEEEEVRELGKREKYKKTVSAYEEAKRLIYEERDLTSGDTMGVLIKLQSYIEELQGQVPEGVPPKEIYPEVLKYSIALNVGLARQYLIFHRNMAAWSNRMEATQEYIEKYTAKFTEDSENQVREKKGNK